MKKCLACLLALMMIAAAAGCGQSAGEASVQSVRMICGLGSVGLVDRFAGMVAPQGETSVQKNENAQIGEMKVAVGDVVEEGQTLFTYDTAQINMDLQKASLELEKMKTQLDTLKKDKETLEKEREEAEDDATARSLLLDIMEIEADITESSHNISLKNMEIQRLQESLKTTAVTAPCTGRIQSLNEQGGYDDMGNPLPFLTIVQTDDYRVKGYVNENSVSALGEGTAVLIRSRTDDQTTWQGTVSMIDWENPQQNQNYYGDSDTVMASKYPFYVALSDSTGLLLGQHVFIEPDYGQAAVEDANTLHLPAYYIVNADTSPYVWAQGKGEKLEKRSLTLGDYDPDMDTYTVESGLSPEDYIAFPDETLKPGMTCLPFDESTFTPDASYEDGAAMEAPGVMTEFSAPVPATEEVVLAE